MDITETSQLIEYMRLLHTRVKRVVDMASETRRAAQSLDDQFAEYTNNLIRLRATMQQQADARQKDVV